MYYEYMTTQYFGAIFFIHLKSRVESFWGVLSCCLTPSILFNFRYKKIKTYMANLFTYFDGGLITRNLEKGPDMAQINAGPTFFSK